MDEAIKFQSISDISIFIEPRWLKVQALMDKGIGACGLTGEILEMRQVEGNYGWQIVMTFRHGSGKKAVDYWIGTSAASIREAKMP